MSKKLAAFAVTAAIGLGAVVLILATRSGDDATTAGPAEASTLTADAIAARFIYAYGAFDVEQASNYLAADAEIADLTGSLGAAGTEGTLDELRLLLSLLEAQGYKQMTDSCREQSRSPAGTTVRCPFDFHTIRSDVIGLGPFGGSYFLLTVRDGEIVEASKTWETEEFSPRMWEPFARWVSTAHPQDTAVMYTDGTHSGARLTEGSIRRWEQRSREYAEVKTAKKVEIAESFMEARNAYDAEKAMSLLADDGARVLLMDNNWMERHMPALRLDREALALALEAERLYGVRYESFECRPDPVRWAKTQIMCSYQLDNKLRQINGSSPVERSFGIGIRDDRITNLSFPWLNVGYPGQVPGEGAQFVKWVETEHPEAGGPFDRGKLFRTLGQEVTLILTPESLDLLAGYLEEYEHSSTG